MLHHVVVDTDKRFRGAYCLHHEGGNSSFNVRNIPEDSHLHTHGCENLKSLTHIKQKKNTYFGSSLGVNQHFERDIKRWENTRRPTQTRAQQTSAKRNFVNLWFKVFAFSRLHEFTARRKWFYISTILICGFRKRPTCARGQSCNDTQNQLSSFQITIIVRLFLWHFYILYLMLLGIHTFLCI
jgi:hypothetical protein